MKLGGGSDELNGGGHLGGGAAPQYSPHTTEPVPQIFWRVGRGQDFGREAPKFGAEGAVLENFSDFRENCFFKMQ